jgi:hypothetical protein
VEDSFEKRTMDQMGWGGLEEERIGKWVPRAKREQLEIF